VAEHKEQLADIAAEAILHVAEKSEEGYKADLDDIMVEKKPGESLSDTKLIHGIVVDKEVVHPNMPKRVEKAKIALLDAALEIEKTEFDAKINIESPDQMEAFLQQEENMLKDMVEKVTANGVNVVIAQKGIDDLAQHFLARKGILAVRRVKKSDMEKLAKATGGKVITNLDDITASDLGYAELVEERKIGDDKMTFIEGCKNPKAVAILIRGGTERIVAEAERSIHDALCVARDVVREPKILAGGGAPEMEMARALKKYAESLPGREQLAVMSYAEVWAGIEVLDGKVKNMEKAGVFEPLAVKKQIIKSATEASTMILKIDDIIAAGKARAPPMPPQGPPGMGGMGEMG
jgi:chaperonin GroEL (HSP60 family)